MKKFFKGMLVASAAVTMAVVSGLSSAPAFAMGWQQEAAGWKYCVNKDNTNWYVNCWQWLDSNGDGTAECYYFNPMGYMYANTTTPDGCTVNADGAWTQNGVVQTKAVTPYYAGSYVDQTSYAKENAQTDLSEGASLSDETDLSEFAQECFDLINEEREARGVDALEWDDTVAEACDIRAEELSEKFSHTRPDGSRCFTALEEVGDESRTKGENIAEGYRTPAAAVKAWMHSTGHRRNILTPKFTRGAIGFYSDGSRYYWVQMFAG